MKTIQELYKEVIASDELKKEFMEATRDEKEAKKKVGEFLKKHGCDATIEEVKAFFEEKLEGELDEDDLEAVAGGKIDDSESVSEHKARGREKAEMYEMASSVGFGLGCVVLTIVDVLG